MFTEIRRCKSSSPDYGFQPAAVALLQCKHIDDWVFRDSAVSIDDWHYLHKLATDFKTFDKKVPVLFVVDQVDFVAVYVPLGIHGESYLEPVARHIRM